MKEKEDEIIARWCAYAASHALYHPLEAAVRFGSVEDVAALLEHGRECVQRLSPSSPELCGFTPRLLDGSDYETQEFIERCGSLLEVAITKDDSRMARYLVSCGADVNGRKRTIIGQIRCLSPLARAIVKQNAPMVRFLLDAGAEVEASDYDGYPLLHYATKFADAEIVRMILDHGVRVDLRWCGYTPLYFPSYHLRIETVQLLLDRGADINDSLSTPLSIAIAKHAPPEWIRELIRRGADTEFTGDKSSGKSTPLLLAAQTGNVSATRILLSARANVAAVDSSGKTALMCAAERGDHEIVRCILDSPGGAETLETKDIRGKTAMDYAPAYAAMK